MTHAASAAIASLVPVNLKLILASFGDDGQHLALAQRLEHGIEFSSGMTMPWTSTTLAMAGIGSL